MLYFIILFLPQFQIFGFAASGTVTKKSSQNSILHDSPPWLEFLVNIRIALHQFLFPLFVLIQKVEPKNQDAAKACARHRACWHCVLCCQVYFMINWCCKLGNATSCPQALTRPRHQLRSEFIAHLKLKLKLTALFQMFGFAASGTVDKKSS